MNIHCSYQSPIGELRLFAQDDRLTALLFAARPGAGAFQGSTEQSGSPLLDEAGRQLDAYFQGRLQRFDLPFHLAGTPFQVRAWEALQAIPYGETISYQQQAAMIGSVPRAVGWANSTNPIPIILPCHRVIGANGKLVGYGGGLERKKSLLNFEAEVRDFGPHALAEVCSRSAL